MSDSDSDAPEEFTAGQGLKLEEEIRKVQKENNARIIREAKDRRRKFAQNITPRPPKADANSQDVSDPEPEPEPEPEREPNTAVGFLPKNIVQMLEAKEKKNLLTDNNEENAETRPTTSRKRKSKKSGFEPVIITSEVGPSPCVHSALDFLKERKLSVARSSSVLNNSNQALRLLSRSGVIHQK